jgi:hypothetical protein
MGLGLFAMAALAVASNSAFAGHTAAEVLMFLGDGVVNPDGTEMASFTGGSTPSVDAFAGDTVAFPVYVQVTPGDGGHSMNALAYDMWASTGNELITGGSATMSGVPNWTGVSADGTFDGATIDGAYRRITKRAYDVASDPSEFTAVGDAIHIGWVSVDVSAAALDGDLIELSFGIGEGSAAGASGNSIVPAITPFTFAFGWDAAGIGGLNTSRQQAPAADVIGSTLNHRSTLIDGAINIIPEPATFGLLGLGLLAIRRRRA